uniref:ShKT domain-containing protein n=1 Tax=Parastrongyloides trichosuri TaxID=131310 RepID=A0A0N4Z933_PARTI
MKPYCDLPSYSDIMNRECPQTCNKCENKEETEVEEEEENITSELTSIEPIITSTTESSSLCYEDEETQCEILIEYCKNHAYETVMKTKCPITCGFCEAPMTTRKSLKGIRKTKNKKDRLIDKYVDEFLSYFEDYDL